MAIFDENKLLSDEEHKVYQRLLKVHGHKPEHFFLEVMEDQNPMDMNDINYVIIIKTKATHLKNENSKTYYSRAATGTWLAEFEQDLKKGYFKPS